MVQPESRKQTNIKIDHEGQTVCYTVDVAPGQTQIDVSYDGPMAVYDASSRKNGTFTGDKPSGGQ